MKLLFCTRCRDLFKLSYTARTCQCGVSRGAYKEDGDHAWIQGQGMMMGVDNREFEDMRRGDIGPARIFRITNSVKVEVLP